MEVLAIAGILQNTVILIIATVSKCGESNGEKIKTSNENWDDIGSQGLGS